MAIFVPELDRALIVEATRHTHVLWSAGRSLPDYTAYLLQQIELAGPALLHVAGLVDETGLVASMKRYGLAIVGPDGRALPALGIGAVFTREDARGRGFGSTLIREALRDARARGARAAWLHAEIDPAYYARLGFVELPGWSWRARASALPPEGALSLRLALPDDLDRMLAWYDESFRCEPVPWLRPARSAEVWRFFSFRNRITAWILEDAGRDVGYLAASPDAAEGQLWIDEWAAPGVSRDRILATARAFAEREQLATVASWLRPDHAGPPFERSPRPTGTPMIALMDVPWTAAAIDPMTAHFGSFDYF